MEELIEQWLPVIGFNDYQVSSLGRVKSIKFGKERILKPGLSGKVGNQYLFVVLCDNEKRLQNIQKVHHIVAAAFLGPRPNNQVVMHLDGHSFNNHASNLAYGTQSQNIRAAIAHGTKKIIPIQQLALDESLIKIHNSYNSASRATGVALGSIQNALYGRSKTAGGYLWRLA